MHKLLCLSHSQWSLAWQTLLSNRTVTHKSGLPSFHPCEEQEGHMVTNHFSMMTFQTDTWGIQTSSNWGAFVVSSTLALHPFTPHLYTSKNQLFTVRNEAHAFIHLDFWEMRVRLWYWALPTLLRNANKLLGFVADLSVMFCGWGNSHLGWRVKSGILTMNFLVFNRLKSKVHIVL